MSLPNRLRLRPDLVLQPQDPAAGSWVVKDPISLRFFLFGADEHFILERLNGSSSADDILDDFARERAPRRMTRTRLHGFLADLYRTGLLLSDAVGQSSALIEREDRARRREAVAQWTNLLAIRLPGLDPDAWLDRTYPLVRWCFRWWFLVACVALWALAGAILIGDWGALATQWPRMSEFLGPKNLVLLALTLAVIKVVHELAHAFTCKHFGGRCHEIGLMLLVMTPCLYCDVSDAWMIQSRWRRIAISAAGIFVELVIAAAAVIAWRYTLPGVFNTLCFNAIVVCSVGTLLFNGNPLLKYDGYYMLSDLVGIPNLWQESRSHFYGRLGEWLLGRRAPAEPGQWWVGWFLAGYAVASIVYRWVLLATIFLFLYRLVAPLGLEVALLPVAASIGVQTGMSWSAPVTRWWRDPTRAERVRKGRVSALVVGLLVVVLGILFVPLPCRVAAPMLLEPRDAERVYVATPGVVVEAATLPSRLEKGQVLARLENADLTAERLRLEGERRRVASRVASLESRQSEDTTAAAQLLVAREILADLSEQVGLLDDEIAGLEVRAPRAGHVIVPPPTRENDREGRRLPVWEGSPLDPENCGCFVERGVWIASIGEPTRCDAVALVDESDVTHLQVGQPADVWLGYSPTAPLKGKVVEIGQSRVEVAPAELAVDQGLAVSRASSGELRPLRSVYQVRLEVEPADVPQLIGARGEARIRVAPQSLARRIERWVNRTWTANADPSGR